MKILSWPEFIWRELREGGVLHSYLARERHRSLDRMRAVARRMQGLDLKAQAKSELEFKAAVPLTEYVRWTNQDPDFWRDDKNLRAYKRDNPDAVVANV